MKEIVGVVLEKIKKNKPTEAIPISGRLEKHIYGASPMTGTLISDIKFEISAIFLDLGGGV